MTKKPQADLALETILHKIERGTVTVDDLQGLIDESCPDSIRDRVRRRTNNLHTRRHLDADEHDQTGDPHWGDRMLPKRTPVGSTQMQGQGKLGHRHSTQTQNRMRRAASFLESCLQAETETVIPEDVDRTLLKRLTRRLLSTRPEHAACGQRLLRRLAQDVETDLS
jgi:hypothetical protein